MPKPPPGPKLTPVQQMVTYPATDNGTATVDSIISTNVDSDSSSAVAATAMPLIGPPAVYQRGTAPARRMKGIRITPEAGTRLEVFAARTHHAAGALVEEALNLYEQVYTLAEHNSGVWEALNTWLQAEREATP